jgi:hypothetical protein
MSFMFLLSKIQPLFPNAASALASSRANRSVTAS